MLTLAVDCALRMINLGAFEGEKFLGELSAQVGTKQAELLPSAVQNFLSILGKTVRDVEHIAVTVGPGYYTGIRVGLSYASALAESVNATVAGVSTLRAMALSHAESLVSAKASATVASVIPASRDSIYAAIYGPRCEGDKIFLAPSHIKHDDFVEFLESTNFGRDVIIIGNEFPDEFCPGFNRISPVPGMARGILGAVRDEKPADPASLKGVYLRPPY
jgi:tRNA threonylcarbamoyladenosine biosynthesis protein TsaB